MKKYLNQFTALIIAAALLSACGASTQIVGSWQKPEIKSLNYQKVLVASLTNNITAQQKVEQELALIFTQPGVTVVKSLDAFPPDIDSKQNKDKDALLKKIKGYDSDIIVTNTVVDKKVKEYYNRSPYAFGPWGWGGYWGHYRGYYGGFYDSGYATLNKEYYLETNVFDSKSGDLIWSAQSRTSNPSNLNSFVEEYAKVIAQKMLQDGIIRR